MRNRPVVVGVAAALVVVVLWWLLVFSGIRSDTSDVEDEVEAARQERQSLQAQLDRLEDLEARGPEIEAQLLALREALPEQPDLASFITQAYDIGNAAGVVWVSVAPSDPVQTGAVATIQLTVEVQGGYFQVLDYLDRLEELPRFVTVDSISVSTDDASGGQGAGASFGGAPGLRASLTARMFSLSAVREPVATTTTSVPGTSPAPEE